MRDGRRYRQIEVGECESFGPWALVEARKGVAVLVAWEPDGETGLPDGDSSDLPELARKVQRRRQSDRRHGKALTGRGGSG